VLRHDVIFMGMPLHEPVSEARQSHCQKSGQVI